MTEAEARAARMFDALNDLERRERRKLTLAELGARVAVAEGRAEPYAPSVVRRWLKGLAEPSSIALWRAIGAVLGVDPAALAFGAPAPRTTPTQSAPIVLTPEETATPATRPPAASPGRRKRAG